MKVLTFSVQILTLHFVVLSFDRYSRDDVVGEVRDDREKKIIIKFFIRENTQPLHVWE